MTTRRIGRWAVVAIVAMAIVLLFVLPGRTFLAQRHSLATSQAQLHLLNGENSKLSGRIAQLKDPSQIEQIARSEYGLVMPGQQAYVILPSRQGTASYWSRTGF